ncbi:ser/arg-rich protein kinase 4 [Corchorus olitorius]|uniref:Ser/arg-rich protein kinase 4 n=1 Tax=Corchorus olitorius TaxID=93759 RepID=A0A1R3JTR3_9ROSI|nr:ser/arg-rich protein kinase 4 [Corchorus olitorius]
MVNPDADSHVNEGVAVKIGNVELNKIKARPWMKMTSALMKLA